MPEFVKYFDLLLVSERGYNFKSRDKLFKMYHDLFHFLTIKNVKLARLKEIRNHAFYYVILRLKENLHQILSNKIKKSFFKTSSCSFIS